MAKGEVKFGISVSDTELGRELIGGLQEALAHVRGETILPVRVVETMSGSRVKEIRKKVSKTPREFERRFHIPARTMEGWEQNRRSPDVAARVLLTVIEKDPEAVERALGF
ncbi:MAG: helix-turn-helix domain-containing protein [Caulobacteraceae bacterium]